MDLRFEGPKVEVERYGFAQTFASYVNKGGGEPENKCAEALRLAPAWLERALVCKKLYGFFTSIGFTTPPIPCSQNNR